MAHKEEVLEAVEPEDVDKVASGDKLLLEIVQNIAEDIDVDSS